MYSIVLILKKYTHTKDEDHNNLNRFVNIAMKYYEKYLDLGSLTEFIIITASAELEEISKTITNQYPTSKWPWMFYSEDQLLHKTIPFGPARDQILRLAIAPLIKTQNYLILNTNSFLIKNLSESNIIINDKPILNKIDIDYPFHYLTSSQLLHFDYDKVQNSTVMGKTPQIYITNIVKDLIKWLVDIYGNQKLWQIILINNKFYDHALYWVWLVKNNLTDQYQNFENANVATFALNTFLYKLKFENIANSELEKIFNA